METTPNGWNIVESKRPILMFAYSFGPGSANALAVGTDAGLVVVSPPCGVASGVFDDLATYGGVRALVASNAYHHMGLREWKARFPDAPIFAPAQSIARVEKQTGLTGIRPLSETASFTGPQLELIDMPHYKTGEVLVRIQTDAGAVWYVTDVVMNIAELPKHPLFKLIFKISKSGPGLKFNNVASMFMIDDKKALKRWLAAEMDKSPPTRLIPCHGEILEFGSKADALRQVFATN